MNQRCTTQRTKSVLLASCLAGLLFFTVAGCNQRSDKHGGPPAKAEIDAASVKLSQIGMFGEITSEAATNGYAGMRKIGNDDRGAVEEFSKAIKLNPKIENFYILRATAKINLKDYADTLFDLNKLIEIDPKNANYYRVRGKIERQLKDNKMALVDFIKAIELNPDDVDARAAMTNLQNGVNEVSMTELRGNLSDGLSASLKHVEFEVPGGVFHETISISVQKP